jgi:protoporphyrinogen oxidase
MQLGSKEHKAQLCEELIKTYYENIWKDEIYLLSLEELKGDKRKEIAAIDLKLDAKEFKSKNEGEKAKFVAEQELAHLDKEIQAVTEKIQNFWPARIKMVEAYLDKK